MKNKILNNYFFILFSIIPISIVIGPAVSLINILLIDLSFVFFIFYTKEFYFLKNKTFKLIALLYLYLIFNSLISQDFLIGANRNFGFIRFIILFAAFNYFFYKNKFFYKILVIWTLTLIVICLDTYFESYTGKNILGYGNGTRVFSFFKDEPIVGGYINAFYLAITGYFYFIFKDYPKKYKILFLIISILLFISIVLSGERSNTIKALIGFFIFYFLNKDFAIKEKIISLALIIILFTGIFSSSYYLKLRYVNQTFDQINSKEKIVNFYEDFLYFRINRSGIEVFQQYPLFGAGNKNYRLENSCAKGEIINDGTNLKGTHLICQTHPHQIYIEFLSEHGLIGSIILLTILFKLIFDKFKIVVKTKNYLQLGCIIYLSTIFVPILPSGSFFNDYNLTLFLLNLSILYASNPKTNIFNKSKFRD